MQDLPSAPLLTFGDMMRFRVSRLLLRILLSAVACRLYAIPTHHQGTLSRVTVPAASLANNKIGDSTVQPALIYLPPSYEAGSKRYPVLYLLHGFSLHPSLQDWGEVIQGAMDVYSDQNPEKAFIVVIPNAFNAVDGSFYENSTRSGNWDDFISRDLVQFIDSKYRTIPTRESRAIAGHSMGGFGALRMMMLHADVFSVSYSLSPCCLNFVADFTRTNPEWRKTLTLTSVGSIQEAAAHDEFWPVAFAAFAVSTSPEVSGVQLARYPYVLRDGKLIEDPATVAAWRSAMPLNMIATHIPQLKRATAIGLDYGYEDAFTHIPATVPEMASRLMEAAIPVQAAGYHGDHNNRVVDRVNDVMIPFIGAHLRFGPTAR